jgi:hypothetical protein
MGPSASYVVSVGDEQIKTTFISLIELVKWMLTVMSVGGEKLLDIII